MVRRKLAGTAAAITLAAAAVSLGVTGVSADTGPMLGGSPTSPGPFGSSVVGTLPGAAAPMGPYNILTPAFSWIPYLGAVLAAPWGGAVLPWY